VKDVQSAEDTTTAIIEVINIAPNDKPTDSFHYTVACSDGTAEIDTRALLTGMSDEYKGSCFTTLSNNLKVGHIFEDCTFSSIRKKAYFETRLYNRKITALETVTVAAGTFEAFVIEYDMYTLMKQGISAKFDKHHKDWYVPGKGIVKSESFQPNKKYTPGDKPFFYSELTAIKKESDH
jgi:hypothetical protein